VTLIKAKQQLKKWLNMVVTVYQSLSFLEIKLDATKNISALSWILAFESSMV
jgi:hypothetical protein